MSDDELRGEVPTVAVRARRWRVFVRSRRRSPRTRSAPAPIYSSWRVRTSLLSVSFCLRGSLRVRPVFFPDRASDGGSFRRLPKQEEYSCRPDGLPVVQTYSSWRLKSLSSDRHMTGVTNDAVVTAARSHDAALTRVIVTLGRHVTGLQRTS